MTNQDMELMKQDWDFLRGVLVSQNSQNKEVMFIIEEMDKKISKMKAWFKEYNNIQVEMGT